MKRILILLVFLCIESSQGQIHPVPYESPFQSDWLDYSGYYDSLRTIFSLEYVPYISNPKIRTYCIYPGTDKISEWGIFIGQDAKTQEYFLVAVIAEKNIFVEMGKLRSQNIKYDNDAFASTVHVKNISAEIAERIISLFYKEISNVQYPTSSPSDPITIDGYFHSIVHFVIDGKYDKRSGRVIDPFVVGRRGPAITMCRICEQLTAYAVADSTRSGQCLSKTETMLKELETQLKNPNK